MNQATLVLCIHNHQPVGNLPEVFEDAYRRAYLPFLEALESFPDVKLVLHNTGPLLEWFEEHAPDYLERVGALIARGQVEVLTGGFYEPILPSVPERDGRGQIEMLSDYVTERFGVRPRGMWLAERVWEPRLAKTIGEAGVEYLPLDDYEFRLAGLSDEELVGSFVTEDQGVPVRVFPISKRLRYAIPFSEPEDTLSVMRALAERGPGLVAVFGDDGEKFGVWPGTHAHVHKGGWLKRFFRALCENADWLRTATFAEVIDELPPRGRVYLPTASYPEMMQWALPTPARRDYEEFSAKLGDEGLEERFGPFVSGGTWKNFIAKYEESNLMIRKMMRVSDKVARAARAVEVMEQLDDLPDVVRSTSLGPAFLDPESLADARRELWRGQCNCAYWHGVFGGLYLPHLRSAIYEHLIAADRLLDSARCENWDISEVLDHDLDGFDEVLLESHWANVYVAPERGGTIFELDVRRASWNVTATMARYEEAYHHEIQDDGEASYGEGVRSIHDGLALKEKGLAELARGDTGAKLAAVDHFYAPGAKRSAVERGGAELGDCAHGRYEFELARREGAVGVTMTRTATVHCEGGDRRVEVVKHVWLDHAGFVGVEYALKPDGDLDVLFAPEWNLAFLTGDPDWVRLDGGGGGPLALKKKHTLEEATALDFSDKIRGERLTMACDPAATVWVWPLETASHSEGGLERVFQGVTVTACWRVRAAAGERFTCGLELRSVPLECD